MNVVPAYDSRHIVHTLAEGAPLSVVRLICSHEYDAIKSASYGAVASLITAVVKVRQYLNSM